MSTVERIDALPPRIASKITIDADGCWIWTASRNAQGYGQVRLDGTTRLAHRVVYESLVGPIPVELEIDHLCRVHACVNPSHLEPVTHAENVARGHGRDYQAHKTHCPAGHPYSPENTYRPPKGDRHCRVCLLWAKRRYRASGGRR